MITTILGYNKMKVGILGMVVYANYLMKCFDIAKWLFRFMQLKNEESNNAKENGLHATKCLSPGS
jgi:hypothetical protein